jgi:hypothetical protein
VEKSAAEPRANRSKLLPPGFELTGITQTDKGSYLKMKETKFGNSFFVGHDDIKTITPKQ